MGRIRDRLQGKDLPPVPTQNQLYSGPAAQWGQYDPNTGTTYTAPNGTLASSSGAGTITTIAGRTPTEGAQKPVFNQTTQSPVAMGNVKGDQTGWEAAQQALQQMRERSQTGWSSLDRMALDQANRQASQYEQSQREASRQNMAARGMTGSGLDALSGMMAQQAGADRSYDNATTLGIAGRDRAMQNTAAAANLGLGMNDTAFNQAAQRAAAVDAFNMWSTSRQDQAAADVYAAQMARQAYLDQRRSNLVDKITGGAEAFVGGISGIAGAVRGGSGGGGQ